MGEIQKGKRHGQGVMKYNSGRVYEGEWEIDIRCGKGFERYTNHNSYVGEFKQSKPCGKGVYKWGNGEVYDGEWHNGLKHGYGIWKGIYGDSYIGEWKNSKADGYGVHTWSNGDRYEGEWKACLKHGNGTDIFANGDIYIGHYKDGKPSGYGQYIWESGSSYVGNFKDGLKHGKGKWKQNKKGALSNTYEGEYYNDVKQGEGVFRWASGNVYIGRYKNDERDGHGEMMWTDGSKYVGEWKNGIQNGFGKMEFPNGTVKEGYFDNNIFKGKKKPEEPVFEDHEVPLENSKMDPIEQEDMWEKYGQERKGKGKPNVNTSGDGWYYNPELINEGNVHYSALDAEEFDNNMIHTTHPKDEGGVHPQNAFDKARNKNTADTTVRRKARNSKTRMSSTGLKNKKGMRAPIPKVPAAKKRK